MTAEWRPLLIGEYPPPGPTKYGPARDDGLRPILVFAERLPEWADYAARKGYVSTIGPQSDRSDNGAN